MKTNTKRKAGGINIPPVLDGRYAGQVVCSARTNFGDAKNMRSIVSVCVYVCVMSHVPF